MSEAVFRRDGDSYVPTASATGPWGTDRLHGGPVAGLFARAFEAAATDPELVVARLTLDLFRPVPLAPLGVRVDTVRSGSRLSLMHGELLVAGEPFARASALLLRASDEAPRAPRPAHPPAGPDGLLDESLMRGLRREGGTFPPGFHTRVVARWVPRTADGPLAIWFRLPIPLIDTEQPSPLQLAVALADFANALASIAAPQGAGAVPYINTDATLYLTRRPVGEWFCLQQHAWEADAGVGVSETLLWDATGAFGRALQSRLANRYRR